MVKKYCANVLDMFNKHKNKLNSNLNGEDALRPTLEILIVSKSSNNSTVKTYFVDIFRMKKFRLSFFGEKGKPFAGP